MADEEVKPLSRKHQVFVAEYLKCFNASEAARRAGYNGQSNVVGPRLFADVSIRRAIDAKIAELKMSADEGLLRLADMARGDIGELIDDNGLLDIRQAREKGMTKLLRKIKQKTITRIGKSDDDDDMEITEIEFEMYSAKDAIETILKAGGNLKDTNIEIRVSLSDD